VATYWANLLTPGLTGTYAYSFPSTQRSFDRLHELKTQELGCPCKKPSQIGFCLFQRMRMYYVLSFSFVPTTFVTSLLKNGILQKTYRTSSARTSRGRKFQRKNHKSKKEFAYRMRARRPTSAMPKPFAVPW